MKRIRIFDHLANIDAFVVTPEYKELAEYLGLIEWNPVVWIGRLFLLDNDRGEHWFDNWDTSNLAREHATRLGLDPHQLLFLDPDRFQDGVDGPCHTRQFRARFWRDVLVSLELSVDLIFDEARDFNEVARRALESDSYDPDFVSDYIPDLEERIARWCARYLE